MTFHGRLRKVMLPTMRVPKPSEITFTHYAKLVSRLSRHPAIPTTIFPADLPAIHSPHAAPVIPTSSISLSLFSPFCRQERFKSLFYCSSGKNKAPKGFCREVFWESGRQKPFLSVSPEKQPSQSHFFQSSGKKSTPKGFFIALPEKTTLQKAFGTLRRSLSESLCVGQN